MAQELDSQPHTQIPLSELAELCGMTTRNVRAYQQRGLLSPPTRQGRSAYYGLEHVARLRLISALHEHGLTLRVIRELIDRGTADSELSRLGREQVNATLAKSTRVPMREVLVEWMEEHLPDGLAELVEVGLIEQRADGRYYGSATALGLTAAMSKRGLTPDVFTSVALAAAFKGRETASALALQGPRVAELAEPDREEAYRLLVQFAAVCFADELTNQLLARRP